MSGRYADGFHKEAEVSASRPVFEARFPEEIWTRRRCIF